MLCSPFICPEIVKRCPLLEVKRTSGLRPVTSAFDPKRTSELPGLAPYQSPRLRRTMLSLERGDEIMTLSRILIGILLLLVTTADAAAADAKRILLIHSFAQEFSPWRGLVATYEPLVCSLVVNCRRTASSDRRASYSHTKCCQHRRRSRSIRTSRSCLA